MLFCRGFKNDSDICMPTSVQYEIEKNHLGGRKVVVQATVLAYWAQIVGWRLPALPNRLRLQCTQERTCRSRTGSAVTL